MSHDYPPTNAGMHCDRALEVLPRYLDGELHEPQAAALRSHLLACPACRAAAAEGRALTRWFVPTEAPAVPEGFAARVAAAAHRSDAPVEGPGEGPGEVLGVGQASRSSAGSSPGALTQPALGDGGSLRDFVLLMTAVAAAALFALSVVLGMRGRPAGEPLMAEPLGEVLQALEALNAQAVEGGIETQGRSGR